jgi:hypothetical protein
MEPNQYVKFAIETLIESEIENVDIVQLMFFYKNLLGKEHYPKLEDYLRQELIKIRGQVDFQMLLKLLSAMRTLRTSAESTRLI